ncbi:MAG: hypothetical protein CFE45_01590 [Burkholderiales bacterium PBB5]|nr:MAG: hypothetical protein CFE45_01590 [Burkholderiales bacterium PBB5]
MTTWRFRTTTSRPSPARMAPDASSTRMAHRIHELDFAFVTSRLAGTLRHQELPVTPTLSIASQVEAGDIAALVNRAYRPATAMGGWTHEADLVRGPRTTESQVMALMKSDSVILTLQDEGIVIACAHVAWTGEAACIGMLATDPALQGMGLGTQMLRYALDRRSELVAFYERRGYRRTGALRPSPLAKGIGVPGVANLKVLQMAKAIEPRRPSASTAAVVPT